MRRRYVLAPEAALDLVQIWRDVRKNADLAMADRVESVIREKIVFLAGRPGAGHWREDLTDAAVRFFPIFSYLIVYRPETTPLQIIAILHGRRDGGTIPSRPLIADLTLYSGYGLSPAIIPPPASTFASPCPTQSV